MRDKIWSQAVRFRKDGPGLHSFQRGGAMVSKRGIISQELKEFSAKVEFMPCVSAYEVELDLAIHLHEPYTIRIPEAF